MVLREVRIGTFQMNLDQQRVERFFQLAWEREDIRLRRAAGEPAPWTRDELFANRHFCNVYRKHDKTTVEIYRLLNADVNRANVPATALCLRLINRYESFMFAGHRGPLGIVEFKELSQKLNTNAYRINTPLGLNSHAGVFMLIDDIWDNRAVINQTIEDAPSVREAWANIHLASGVSDFIRYQAILDLRGIGAFAGKQDDWAYAGMGARRGLARITGQDVAVGWTSNDYRNYHHSLKDEWTQEVMQAITAQAQALWGRGPWGIHETEGWLCEYDKYERGGGHRKRRAA